MAKALITLGGEIDVASGEELQTGLLDVKRHNERLIKSERPLYRPLMGSIPNAAAGTNTAYFSQTPPSWAEWHVLSYAIGINDDHSTASIAGTPQTFNNIPLAASGVASYNNNPFGVNITIAGGTVSAIAINGTNVGATSGTFFVPAGGTVTVTYTVAPTTFTTSLNAFATPTPTVPSLASLYAGDPFNPMLGTVKLPGRPVPDSNTMGPGRIIIHPGEYIFWVFYNVGAGALIWTNMQVAEFAMDTREMTKI